MGHRTVVVLHNDSMHNWEVDPFLGQKIAQASHALYSDIREPEFQYGRVVESTHADTVTLCVLKDYTMQAIDHTHYSVIQGKSPDDVALAVLKLAAERLGYSLRKKPVRKERVFKQIETTGKLPVELTNLLGITK